MNESASGRCAVVTGTTSGIGLAVVRALLDRDWRVIGVARRPSELIHDAYEHVQLDLHDITALTDRLEPRLTTLFREAHFERVGLVNNAADPGLLGPVAHLDPRRLPGVLTTNVVAPVFFMGALVRHAPTRAALRIVNVSSGAAVNAFAGLAAYGASKSALRMSGMVLATELENPTDPLLVGRDIAILSYEPSTVDTPMQAFARSQSADVLPSRELFVRFAAEQRLVSPEMPAREIVAFLEGDTRQRFSERRLGATPTEQVRTT